MNRGYRGSRPASGLKPPSQPSVSTGYRDPETRRIFSKQRQVNAELTEVFDDLQLTVRPTWRGSSTVALVMTADEALKLARFMQRKQSRL